jgi:Fe2+ or Zn2+ uptake regulation protein
MKKSKIALSHIELQVLEKLKQIGFKSAFQLTEDLSGKYDALTVMRTLHSLLQQDLLVRVNIQGERYYNLNDKSSTRIKLLLDRQHQERPLLAQS